MKSLAKAGFTLIEALIAIAISAFVFVVLAVMLQNTARAVGNINADLILFEEKRTAADALGHLFQTAEPPIYDNDDARFRGDAKSISFAAAPSPTFGPAVIHLSVIGEETGERLLIDAAPTVPRLGAPASAATFAGSASIIFSYYGATDKKTPPTWRTSWTLRHPPQLVGLDIVFADPARDPLHYEFSIPARAPSVCPVIDPVCRVYGI